MYVGGGSGRCQVCSSLSKFNSSFSIFKFLLHFEKYVCVLCEGVVHACVCESMHACFTEQPVGISSIFPLSGLGQAPFTNLF